MSALAAYREKGCLTVGCASCGICLATEQEETMSEQKHTVSTDALATLGTIIDESAGRDAIHLAVEPVIAFHDLLPGQDVGIEQGKALGKRPYVGIVDPFLTKNVKEGERFWLVVYPRQITSLRHVWEHPSFPAAVDAVARPAPADDLKANSEAWMKNYADEIDETVTTLMRAATARLDHGEWFYGGSDDYDSRGKFEGESTHPDFWHHYQIITGRVVEPNDQENFFTCLC